MYEPEDDYKVANKKPANGENRGRLEDHHQHRPSPPDRAPSPRVLHERNSSEVRREEQRRANENYHPSEAAHHPPTLPSLHQQQEQQQQQQQQQQQLPPMTDSPRDERRAPEPYEGAARKVDMDENYDDEAEDEKRMGGSGGRSSPQRGPGLTNGQAKSEPQS